MIQEERSEVSISKLEEEIPDDGGESEEEGPVFLDLSGLKQGRELEVVRV